MKAYVEHVNIEVGNVDEAVRFLKSALPEFEVRGRGSNNGERWLHIGTEATYLALNEGGSGRPRHGSNLNHVGFVVDDVAAIKARLKEAGYQEGFVADPHPFRKRLYFLDRDGVEWEFVEYLTNNPAERNFYD
jgi:catechol 2,3-dioxygenase-like lactoylglutathione lyase family enzyme